ncbi:hypothetical protein DT73_17195 [Mangrovibacter sp. MFB070]|nr:hypothetical protein DT73_17195 [Mangrovibacter sp. MFB070]
MLLFNNVVLGTQAGRLIATGESRKKVALIFDVGVSNAVQKISSDIRWNIKNEQFFYFYLDIVLE